MNVIKITTIQLDSQHNLINTSVMPIFAKSEMALTHFCEYI